MIIALVRGKFDCTVSNRMQNALNYCLKWCKKEGLNINPSKTTIIPFTTKRKVDIKELTLNNQPIALGTQVKFLGVILDQKLNWNAHLEYAISKSLSTFWVCSKTFGKSWGLKPNMISWIYTAISRPRLSYAALVWWPKTLQETTRKKLCKLQRVACLSITGASKSTPSSALDAILNLLPLPEYVQLEAEKAALKLKRTDLLQNWELKGHLKILNRFNMNALVTSVQDWMITKPNFYTSFKVIATDRSIWAEGGPTTRIGSINFFIDGSKMNNNAGAGIYGPGVNISIPMGGWPTVFQTEVYAIYCCVEICLKRMYRHANICIFSDSQAAIRALKAPMCNSKLVWDCINALNQLSIQNQVNLYWVPGHCGIEGNEKADELARKGSERRMIGPEPFCGVSTCALTSELKKWENSKIKFKWLVAIGARQSKKFIKPDSKKTCELLSLSKRDLKTITDLFTGHCPCNYHLHKIGKLSNEMCRFCQTEVETAEHLMCDCGYLMTHRLKVLGKRILTPDDIWKMKASKVVGFIRNTIPNWNNVSISTTTAISINDDSIA